jgi:hypothetical protein
METFTLDLLYAALQVQAAADPEATPNQLVTAVRPRLVGRCGLIAEFMLDDPGLVRLAEIAREEVAARREARERMSVGDQAEEFANQMRILRSELDEMAVARLRLDLENATADDFGESDVE